MTIEALNAQGSSTLLVQIVELHEDLQGLFAEVTVKRLAGEVAVLAANDELAVFDDGSSVKFSVERSHFVTGVGFKIPAGNGIGNLLVVGSLGFILA